MEALKDSKVEWLGQIPESWKVERISTLYSPRNTKVNDEDFPPLSVTMQGVLPGILSKYHSLAYPSFQLVRAAGIVLTQDLTSVPVSEASFQVPKP